MTTEERLEKLDCELASVKRRDRWLLAIATLAVCGLGLALILKATLSNNQDRGAETVAKVIRANSFACVDENGIVRGLMYTAGDSVMFGLLDKNGKPRATLVVDNDRTGLAMDDENGKTHAMLVVSEDHGVVSVSSGEGKDAIAMQWRKNGPNLLMLDANGKPRATLNMFLGQPSLTLWTEYGGELWAAP